MIFSAGLFLLLLKTCHALDPCYFTGGSTQYCEECCKNNCCEDESDGLSAGAIIGIVFAVFAVIAALILRIVCFYMRLQRAHIRTRVTTRTVIVARGNGVTTNVNHTGYQSTNDSGNQNTNYAGSQNTNHARYQNTSHVGYQNSNQAGYNQRTPTTHKSNPYQRSMPVVQQANSYHHGYDQQQPEFEPMPPPPYETVMKGSAK